MRRRLPRTWLGLASTWLSWLMSWLSRLGFQWLGSAGWLAAAGLKSIGRDLWGERERVRRKRERREGDRGSLVGCSAVQGTERTNEQDKRERQRQATDTTRQNTTRQVRAERGRLGTFDRLTGKRALAQAGTLWKARPAKEQNGRAMGGFNHKPPCPQRA